MKTDIQIAQEANVPEILKTAEGFGIDGSHLDFYGKYKAKVNDSLFEQTKNNENGKAWFQWPKPLASRQATALDEFKTKHASAIAAEKFYQYKFYQQWRKLRQEAAQRGISLIGDVPIYVAHDSADVWASPKLFHLDAS